MRDSVRKTLLTVLITLFTVCAVLLGVYNFSAVRPQKNSVEAATGDSDVTFTTDAPDILSVGDKFHIIATFTTSRTDTYWGSFDITVGPLNADGTAYDPAIGSCFQIPIDMDTYELEVDYGPLRMTTQGYTQSTSDSLQTGGYFRVPIACNHRALKCDSSTTVPITITLEVVKEIPVSSMTFGIITSGSNATIANSVSFGSGTSSIVDNILNVSANGLLSVNPVTISTGAANSGAELSSLHVGHANATTQLTLADSMSTVSNSTTKNNYKVLPVLTDLSKGATIQIGTRKPLTATVQDGQAATVTLDDSGTTTVYLNIVSQDKSTTKEYTIQVKSQVALLSGAAVTYSPAVSGATLLGLKTTFSENTAEYEIWVPQDNAASVSLTPTVRAGFGISNTIAVTATACTAAGTVNSGSALSVTGIGDSGSKVVLEVTAADGTTKKSYTFNFVKKSTDTSITNFTVTANDPSGTTIVNDPTQGVDYYFKLPALESGDSKGKMNITAASGATVKLGSNAYSPATECAVGSYTVNVTAPAGNTQSYRVTLAREEVAAVFNSLGIRLPGSTTFEEVLTGNSAYDAATNTYTKTLTIGGANVVGAEIYIEGTRKTGVTYGTPTNLTLSGDTFTGKLALGDNSFSVRIASQGKSNTYTFHIKLTEGKKGITDVVIYDAETGGNVIALSPAFNPSTKTYTVTVPYKNMDNAYFVVTTDGEYTVVDTVSGGRMSRVDGTLNKHKHTRPLAAGATTTVRIHAVADEGKGDSGEEYVINITRAAASTDAKLSGLVVKGPDGTPLKFTDPDGNEVTFNGNTTNYTIKYDGDIAALVVDIEATASGLNAEVNGAGRVNLGSLGATSDNVTRIPITVTAEDGVTKTTYYVAISQKAIDLDDDFTITEIYITGNDGKTYFSKNDFSASTYAYEFDVPYAVDLASVYVEAFATANKFGGGDHALAVGVNTVEVYASAQNGQNSDGAVKYVFTINRAEPITDVYLSNLRVNGGTVDNFDKTTYEYTSAQDVNTSSVSLDAVAEDERAKVTVTRGGEVLGEGTGSVTIPVCALGEPGTSVTLTITLTLDTATTNYTLRITRATDKPLLVYLEVSDGGEVLDLFEYYTNEPLDGTNQDDVSVSGRWFKVKTGNVSGKLTIVARPSDPTSIMNVAISRGSGLREIGEYTWELDMEELFASPDQAIQIVVRPANGSDARDVHRVYFKKLSSETDFGLKIKEIEEFNRNFEEYRNSANGDLAPTFLEYTVVFNQSTITFEVDFGGTDAFIRGTYQILRKRDWNPVAVQNGNLAASDAIGNLNNDELVGFTNETESVVPLVYGLNVLVVNLRSSDETAIQPVVIIIDRELPDFKAIGVLEIEQFTQDYKDNAEYRSKEEKYVYTVANGVSKLNVTIENFEELESEVIGADSLVVGKNTVTIYLYEKTAENGNVAAREGREPVKTVILEINREAAQDNSKMMWMILFFVMLGLALLLLLILLFIPKRKKNAAQQVILAATPYIQPPVMQPPQQPQQPQNGKAPVNVEVRITGDGVVQTKSSDNGRKQ